MKREQAQELYTDYREGTLSPALKLALEQHFEAVPESQVEYRQFTRIYDLLSVPEEDSIPVPHGFRAAVMSRVTAEQETRQAAPSNGFSQWLSGLFSGGSRRVTGGLLAAVGVVTVAAIVFHGATPSGPTVATPGTLMGSGSYTPDTTIVGVTSTTGTDKNLYHLFRVHLPASVPSATVTASVINDTNEITDPALRARQAVPALKQPIELANNAEMQIPVALLANAPAGTTLDVLVQWQAKDGQKSGSQVVFTPVQSNTTGMTASAAPTEATGFYSALQNVAAQYNVTVIADADDAVPSTIAPWPASASVQTALAAIANTATGYSVRQVDASGTTFQVYKNQ